MIVGRRRQVDRRARLRRSPTAARSRARPAPGRPHGQSRPTAARRASVEVERANVDGPGRARARCEHVDGKKVAYVELRTLHRGRPWRAARRDRASSTARGAEGLILDLRGNGGGLLTRRCCRRASSSRTAPSSRRAAAPEASRLSTRPATLTDTGPTVVLVDRDTASAAEILTAALKENDLATVVGTRTYGKGVFQEVIPLDAGGALDLTVGEYLTSDGTSILGKGVDARRPGRGRPGRRRRGARRAASTRSLASRSRQLMPEPSIGRPRARSSRGAALLVVEPLFERGPQVSLARGGVKFAAGRDRARRLEQRGARARVRRRSATPAWPATSSRR